MHFSTRHHRLASPAFWGGMVIRIPACCNWCSRWRQQWGASGNSSAMAATGLGMAVAIAAISAQAATCVIRDVDY